LALVALLPLLLVTGGGRARSAFLPGYLFGLVYLGLTMSWLLPVSILGWSVLVAFQALFFGATLTFVAAVWRDDRPFRTAAAVAAVWVAVEWTRGVLPLGGFTWGTLGTTQHDNPFLLPLASVLGVWGISAVVAAVNVLALEALRRVRLGWGKPFRILGPAAVLALAPGLIPIPTPDGPPVDVAIVQGNVAERLAVAERFLEDLQVARDHAALHRGLANDPPDLAVWPENALDLDPTRIPELEEIVGGAIREVGAWALVGAITQDGDGRLYNDNLLYDPDGGIVETYTKNRLVPFGEYVPFRRHLEGRVPDVHRIRSDLTPGERFGRHGIPGASFASIICFENTFPNYVRASLTPDMGFLVVTTNNSTFGRTAAPDQHLVMSELRAVENGRWVVHAAISGISAFVDPRGNVVDRTDIFVQDVLRGEVRQGSGRTVFNAIGGWLPAVFLLAAAWFLLAPRPPRRRSLAPLGPEPRTLVILPTYDEAETIEQVVRGVRAVGERVEVLVVDDASPDGTAELVRGMAAGDPRVGLVERPEKEGLASAYVTGFRRALESGHDLVVEMDADLSHRPEDLRALLAGAESHHLTIGSRYVPGGAIPDWSLGRRLLSRGGNLYARLLLGLPVRDATSGYRVFRREALAELTRDEVRADGYGFQIELAYRAWRAGFGVGEVPITFLDRTHGSSKLSRRIVFEALWKVLAWGIRDRVLRRPPLTRTPPEVSSTR
jgi:apolipoprotein N-acyltransferase